MHSGSELLETWIPNGGFEIERRMLGFRAGKPRGANCHIRDGALVPGIEARSLVHG
jgi:hypothetical protein